MKDLIKKILSSTKFWLVIAFVLTLFHTRFIVIPDAEGGYRAIDRWTGQEVRTVRRSF